MRIAFLGSFDPYYPINQVLIKGLEKAGASLFTFTAFYEKSILSKLIKIIKAATILKPDITLLGHIGHYHTISLKLAKLVKLVEDKPVALYLLAPLYESIVEDRKLAKRLSPKGLMYFLADKYGCMSADLVITDTYAHRFYLNKTYGIPLKKIIVTYPSADDEIFYPVPKKTQQDEFIVHFHGTFIPFHGVENIIYAAKLLEKYERNIIFHIVGYGQTYFSVRRLAKKLNLRNVLFFKPVAYDRLPSLIAKADICLGAFGKSPKLDRVIPQKIFNAIAMAKPVITGFSRACLEIFENKRHCLFVKPGDPYDLAESIEILMYDKDFAYKMGIEAYRLFKRNFTPKHIGRKLLTSFAKICS